ncbi:histidine phosphatase family protein [Pseudooctadecabacter sp.]|uniref:SixA phosphatase family protein n=1 Tax=Pseudooctadecabacter sp. TaxID=1966338 RepID=UPI0035C80FFF
MTKRLILMRHAKSGWDDPTLSDIDRPLNARGRADATALGGWLKDSAYLPDAVLCSAATRTRETLALLNIQATVTFMEGLYLAPPAHMMEALKDCSADTILLIGHNPGIGDLAQDIVTNAPDHKQFYDYPTGATLVCDLPITNWANAVSRSAQMVDFIVPRDLEAG